MTAVLVAWIISETKESYKDNYLANNSSVLSTIFGLMMLYSIFNQDMDCLGKLIIINVFRELKDLSQN